MTWVLVRAPQGHAPIQQIFVNRKFNVPAGWTGTPFQVAVGVNTFSTRSAIAVTAQTKVDCPDMPEASPFQIALAPMVPVAAAPKAAAKAAPKAKRARKESAKPKTKRPKTAKKAPKRKAAKRKAPKAKTSKRKVARKTAASRKRRA